MVFLSFFASHSGAGFCKFLAVKIDSQQRMKKLFKFTVRKFAHLKFAQLEFVQLLYFCPMLAKKKDALVVTADQGGFEPLTSGHRH